jgi:hypothetical protein
MAALSTPEAPNVAGYGVAMGNGVVHVQLTGIGNYVVGGSMPLAMAAEMARTILKMTGEDKRHD